MLPAAGRHASFCYKSCPHPPPSNPPLGCPTPPQILLRYGVADRGSSIRIPLPVQLKGYGYLEDRRPAANVDPYTGEAQRRMPRCAGVTCRRPGPGVVG